VSDVEVVIFDLDGVLADTAGCHGRAFTRLWRDLGLSGPEYSAIAGRRTLEVVTEVAAGLHPTQAQLATWVRAKQEYARQCLRREPIIYPDVEPALEALARAGLALAVGTAASRQGAGLVLERLGLRAGLAALVTGDDVAAGKPAPDIYVEALARAGTAPERALVVEDAMPGIDAALAAGCRVASVRTGAQAAHPRFIGAFADLREVAAALGAEVA
jgi:HAD superfamily hydrolase (TIGR01509 family)